MQKTTAILSFTGVAPKFQKALCEVTETPSVPRRGSVDHAVTFIPVPAAVGPGVRAWVEMRPLSNARRVPARLFPWCLPHMRAGLRHRQTSPEEEPGEAAAGKA